MGTKNNPSDDWMLFIADLHNMQARAHALGLHQTARSINAAIKRAGWEMALPPPADKKAEG